MRQPKGKRRKENEKILIEIRESHKNSRRAYGSPRITGDLQAKGIICGENRVARLMKINGIVGKAKKKFKATTNSKHNLPVAENLPNQNFEVEKPNTTWVSDITYIWTLEGWLYLAVILDLYSRQVVGWAMSDRLTSDFVIKALYQAIGRRKPGGGCILHSDRGVQYASADFRDALNSHGFIQSMSMITGIKHGQKPGRAFSNISKCSIIVREGIQPWGIVLRCPLSWRLWQPNLMEYP